MRVVIVYESMYGNTHLIAEAIGAGMQEGNEVTVVPVAKVRSDVVAKADLLVAGGPTHVHGMSSARSRRGAVQAASKPASGLTLDIDAEGPGVRDWLGTLGYIRGRAAAFDTRLDAPLMFTGQASKSISKQLERHGLTVITKPESFLVNKDNQLRPGEQDRATGWGKALAAATDDLVAAAHAGGAR